MTARERYLRNWLGFEQGLGDQTERGKGQVEAIELGKSLMKKNCLI